MGQSQCFAQPTPLPLNLPRVPSVPSEPGLELLAPSWLRPRPHPGSHSVTTVPSRGAEACWFHLTLYQELMRQATHRSWAARLKKEHPGQLPSTIHFPPLDKEGDTFLLRTPARLQPHQSGSPGSSGIWSRIMRVQIPALPQGVMRGKLLVSLSAKHYSPRPEVVRVATHLTGFLWR